MADADTIPFPQNRTCPYQPPAQYRGTPGDRQPVSSARLFDGRVVWLVTGHAEARSLLVDPRLSSDRENPDFPLFAERLAASSLRRVELLGVDDPEHNVQRRMLIPSFTVRRTAALRPQIQRTVDGLLDRMIEQGPPADLVGVGHPDQLARMRDSDDLMPSAVEELLRFLSIADGISRVAVEDIEAGGVTIRKGDGVVLSTSAINRDETAYEAPDELDLGRNARNHVAFGFGIHQCLGQNLARAEMEIALRTLCRRLPGLRLAVPAEEVPFKPGDTIQGLIEMPVTW